MRRDHLRAIFLGATPKDVRWDALQGGPQEPSLAQVPFSEQVSSAVFTERMQAARRALADRLQDWMVGGCPECGATVDGKNRGLHVEWHLRNLM